VSVTACPYCVVGVLGPASNDADIGVGLPLTRDPNPASGMKATAEAVASLNSVETTTMGWL
jgi:hypothetical protein